MSNSVKNIYNNDYKKNSHCIDGTILRYTQLPKGFELQKRGMRVNMSLNNGTNTGSVTFHMYEV